MIRLLSHKNFLVLGLALLGPSQVCGNGPIHNQNKSHEYFEVKAGETAEVKNICQDNEIFISSYPRRVIVSTGVYETTINLEESTPSVEIVAGDFWQNGRCFVAIKSSSGLVNEYFDLYRLGKSQVESIHHGLINPEFNGRKVIVAYRDVARWHHEILCYSEKKDQPYICSKRADLNDDIQRFVACDEDDVCGDPTIVHKGTHDSVYAVVSSEKARILRRDDDGDFYRSPAYLIRNDRITLLDFFEEGTSLLFQVIFYGENETTTGWVNAEDISLKSVGL